VVDVTGGTKSRSKIWLANPEVIHAEGEKREEEAVSPSRVSAASFCARNFVTVKAQNAKGESFEIRGEDC